MLPRKGMISHCVLLVYYFSRFCRLQRPTVILSTAACRGAAAVGRMETVYRAWLSAGQPGEDGFRLIVSPEGQRVVLSQAGGA